MTSQGLATAGEETASSPATRSLTHPCSRLRTPQSRRRARRRNPRSEWSLAASSWPRVVWKEGRIQTAPPRSFSLTNQVTD